MKIELQKQLQEKYPKILKNMGGDARATCMAFGIECGDGWYELLDVLMYTLQWDTDKNEHPQVVAAQIKEKYGSLRFYYDLHPTEQCPDPGEYNIGVISGMVEIIESMSNNICEYCGTNQEVIHTDGWIRTLCRKCHKEHHPNESIREDKSPELRMENF